MSLHHAKAPSAAEMRAFDEYTIAGGLPSLELMERAGRGVAQVIIGRYGGALAKGNPLVVLCGPGNNGGDGLVIARYLYQSGFSVTCIVASATQYSADFKAQLEQLRNLPCGEKDRRVTVAFTSGAGDFKALFGHEVSIIPETDLAQLLGRAELLVDALLGTGSSQAPRGSIKTLIELANSARRANSTVVAVDIPSGIDSDSGAVFEPCITANTTCTIELVKRGMLQCPAMERCGEIEVVPIGINCSGASEFNVITPREWPTITQRPKGGHKGTFGTVLVVGGSAQYPGAPVLSAIAALRGGAGLVKVARLAEMQEPLPYPELIIEPLKSRSDYFTVNESTELFAGMKGCGAMVLGPGLGSAAQSADFVLSMLTESARQGLTVVLDADGLNLIAPHLSAGKSLPLSHCIITPHPGEAARLLGSSTEVIQRDRYSAARELAKRSGAIVILKGAGSIVYNAGRGWINRTGNAFMATAGSGDVLAGIIAAGLAQKLTPIQAALFGVHVHGLCGDAAHEAHGGPIIATDIVQAIPEVLGSLPVK